MTINLKALQEANMPTYLLQHIQARHAFLLNLLGLESPGYLGIFFIGISQREDNEKVVEHTVE
jgi:hypothetical protein